MRRACRGSPHPNPIFYSVVFVFCFSSLALKDLALLPSRRVASTSTFSPFSQRLPWASPARPSEILHFVAAFFEVKSDWLCRAGCQRPWVCRPRSTCCLRAVPRVLSSLLSKPASFLLSIFFFICGHTSVQPRPFAGGWAAGCACVRAGGRPGVRACGRAGGRVHTFACTCARAFVGLNLTSLRHLSPPLEPTQRMHTIYVRTQAHVPRTHARTHPPTHACSTPIQLANRIRSALRTRKLSPAHRTAMPSLGPVRLAHCTIGDVLQASLLDASKANARALFV